MKIEISLLVLLLLPFLNFPSIDRSFECPSLDLSLILDYLCFGSLVHFPSFLQIRESHCDTCRVIVHFKRYLNRLPGIRKQLSVFRPYSLVNMKCTRTLLKFAPIVYLWRCRVEYSHHQYTIQLVKEILLNQKVTSETCYYEINVGFKLVLLISNAIRESYLPRLLPSWNLRCHCKCRI